MWKFLPIYKETIWGGQRLLPYKGEDVRTDIAIGESWEISGVEGSESVVAEGIDEGVSIPSLIEKYKGDLLGKKNYMLYGNRFPLLVKFIDAADDLSVQVHPNDEMAHKYGEVNGKTEMWYVINAGDDVRIAAGFRTPLPPKDYHNLIQSGEITDRLRYTNLQPGDAFFIPAGCVHAIGKGALLLEIQQTCDVTYRMFDYHRKDSTGKERELHTEKAYEALNFGDADGKPIAYTLHRNIPVNIVSSQYFITNVLAIDNEMIRDYSELDTFIIIIATEGEASIRTSTQSAVLKAGHTLLIPAAAKNITIEPFGSFTAVETYIK
jgi:mannose-6-phosphate isomerase